MNLDQTMMTFDEAQQMIANAIAKGLAKRKRTELMAAIRDRKPFVIGVSGKVSKLNDNIVYVSQKDFDDIFPQSSGSVFVND